MSSELINRGFPRRDPREREKKVRMSCNELLDVIRTHSQRAPEERAERERERKSEGETRMTHMRRGIGCCGKMGDI